MRRSSDSCWSAARSEPVEPGARQLPAALAELEQWRAAHPPGPPSEPAPGDAEVDAAAGRLAGVVDDIVAWFAEHAPPAATWIEAARGGADAAGIAAAEAALGVRLPASVRAYLRLFGATAGIGIAEYEGLSLDRALHHWRMLEELRAEGAFATWPPRETTPGNGFVQFTWWHPGWLPFAMDSAGNLFCIDLAPAQRGTSARSSPGRSTPARPARSGPRSRTTCAATSTGCARVNTISTPPPDSRTAANDQPLTGHWSRPRGDGSGPCR